MSHKGYSILSREELEKLNTKRLLALKSRLYKLSFDCQTDQYNDCAYYCQFIDRRNCEFNKNTWTSKVLDQIDLIKQICKTREHVI